MISLSQRKVWVNLFAWWGVQKVPRFGLATLKLVPNRLPYSLQSWQLSPALIFMTFKTLSYHQSPPPSGRWCLMDLCMKNGQTPDFAVPWKKTATYTVSFPFIRKHFYSENDKNVFFVLLSSFNIQTLWTESLYNTHFLSLTNTVRSVMQPLQNPLFCMQHMC